MDKDLAHQGQSDSAAVGLGREERRAHTSLDVILVPMRGVLDHYFHRLARTVRPHEHPALLPRRLDVQAIPGTEAAISPFFSPDGRWVGFFANGQLSKACLSSDTVLTATASKDANGAAWAPDGAIVFAPRYPSSLLRVNASGGRPSL